MYAPLIVIPESGAGSWVDGARARPPWSWLENTTLGINERKNAASRTQILRAGRDEPVHMLDRGEGVAGEATSSDWQNDNSAIQYADLADRGVELGAGQPVPQTRPDRII
jgi:hypothetical protein